MLVYWYDSKHMLKNICKIILCITVTSEKFTVIKIKRTVALYSTDETRVTTPNNKISQLNSSNRTRDTAE